MSKSSSSSSAKSIGGYKGKALEVLERFRANTGSMVRLKTFDGFETKGLVVPRYEHADSDHIVLKLRSGYNIGIDAGKVESITVLEESVQPSSFGRSSSSASPIVATGRLESGQKHLLLLSTGGTIASRVDYRTGAVYPALSAEDLYSAVPELGEIASIQPEVVFSTYSENLTPVHWQKLSESIVLRSLESKQSREKKIDGIVIMLGTDTLAYVSAALSFSLIGLGLPVVCVGAQRSSDRPSSDAALNLKAATRFAVNSGLPGVYVSMHETENDDRVAIHSGVRVRKNHTSRRDAFQSIDIPPVGFVRDSEIVINEKENLVKEDEGSAAVLFSEDLRLKVKFDPSVALLKFHPGFDHSVIDYHMKQRGSKGIVIEGTGLGHVSSDTVTKLANAVKNGIFVGMTSQCIWGHVDLNVYETGRDLLAGGVVPLQNMLAETAFAKLSWAIGNFDPSEVRGKMVANLIGEYTDRIPLERL